MTKTTVKVKLVGTDGNAFSILGKVSSALRKAGYADLAKEYMEKSMSGDYNNLLRVTKEYVKVS